MSFQVGFIILAMALVAAFQNCSGAKFHVTGASSSLGSNNGGLGGGTGGQINQPGGTPATGEVFQPGQCANGELLELIAGQHYDIGHVLVGVLDGKLIISLRPLPSVLILESHVDIASSVDQLLSAPGQFPFGAYSGGGTHFNYAIPLSDLNLQVGQTVYLKVHASVVPADGRSGEVINGGETAWATGTPHGVGWSTYVTVTLKGC